MIKSRTAQLIYQTAYCSLAVIGALAGLGFFAADFNADFYLYYTGISNYVCLRVMLLTLIRTAKRREDGYVETAPTFTFLTVILILVTFFVYNVLLAGRHTVVTYFTTLSNVLLHAVLPVMFVLHWVLFCRHGGLKWYHPLLATVMPIVYVSWIVIRAAILKGKTRRLLYPYFFLNVGRLGWRGFLCWEAALLAVFIFLGYLLLAFDRLSGAREQARRKNRKSMKKL